MIQKAVMYRKGGFQGARERLDQVLLSWQPGEERALETHIYFWDRKTRMTPRPEQKESFFFRDQNQSHIIWQRLTSEIEANQEMGLETIKIL